MAISLIAGVAYVLNRDGADVINRLSSEINSTQAEYAAMAGANQLLWQANNANCTGYTNTTNNAGFGGFSYIGNISPSSNSPVSISVTASNPKGTSYTLKRDFLEVYQPLVTKTLQLGTIIGKDASLSSINSSANFGATDSAVLKSWILIYLYKNQLLQFDLAAIPTNAHIVSAQLQLYRKSGSGKGTIKVYPVTQDWEEGTQSGTGTADGATWKTFDGSSTWASNGGDFKPTLMASAVVDGSVAGVQSWDIAPLVRLWLSGRIANKGMLLKTDDLMSVVFASKEDTGVNQPKLVVTYQCECGLTCTGVECKIGNYQDDFRSIAYTVNSGSTGFNWTDNWQEAGESDGANTGKISVISDLLCPSAPCLKIRKDSATVMSISRGLKLAPAVTATLTYNFRRNIVLTNGGAITLQVSKDGGANYTSLKSYPLDSIDILPVSESVDISAFISAKTRIRFVTSGGSFQTNIFIDNINVAVGCTAAPANFRSVTLNPVADTDISAANTSTNYGSNAQVWVGANSSGKKYKGLVKFSVSGIPSNATVTSAKLRLFVENASGTGSMNIGVYKIIANWNESTVTWSNFSSSSNYNASQLAVAAAPLAYPTVAEWVLPNSLINEWRDGVPTPNYGLALNYENLVSNVWADFGSKENSNTALKPQLVINYTLP
ncbi:MAG: DNRLRE domain-containing protein [Methylococcales bacterium]